MSRELTTAITRLRQRSSLHELSHSLAAYLLKTNQIRQLDGLMRELKQSQRLSGVVEVAVMSAEPLDTKTTDSIRAFVQKRYPHERIELHYTINPELIGGVKLVFDDHVFDYSVTSRLRMLKHAVLHEVKS